MKMNRKINALCACSLLMPALLLTSCGFIDDDLDDCYIDMQADYELRLVTNENLELARTLSDRPGIADALHQHLSGVFTDNGRDLDLSFYLNNVRQHQQTEDMNSASTKHVNMQLPIEDYTHLAIANLQGNNVLALQNGDSYNQAAIKLPTGDATIASQKSGIFTGRHAFTNMVRGIHTYHMPLYIANSAAAIVLDPRTCKYTDIKVFTSGFATAFNVADSTYFYDNSPMVLSDKVNLPDTTKWIAYCGVSYPSREPSSNARSLNYTTRSVTQTDQPFLYADCGENIWQYETYVTMTDGTTTKTTLSIRHPLRAGQLKIIVGFIDDQGVVRLYDTDLGESVDVKWEKGSVYPIII